jgi:hypothetical protein
MKNNIMKILAITAFMIFVGAGASLADDNRGQHRNRAYGHFKHRVHHHYHYAPARPVYIEHHYRPVVVERHYYPAPVYYAAPAPSGFFFGMSVADAGSAFSFGVSGQ